MTSTPKQSSNFMQVVGRPVECGHCHPEKYAEGLKQAEKMFTDYKCDCVCHDNSKIAYAIKGPKAYGLECGHCKPKEHSEGLKRLEAAIPDYECNCKCHDKEI